MDVSGKVAVVTGGGSGIGKAIALALAREGAAVAVADIMEASAAAVADEIGRAGGRAVAIACDVSDRASVAAMKRQVNRELGPVSLLVANAGVTMFEELTDMSDDDVDWVIDVSLYGVTHCIQAFLPDMIAAREGHVVATASVAALLAPFVGAHAPYVAAKAGIVGMILSLRPDLAKYGVGASVLCPSAVESSITDSPRYRPASYGGPQQSEVTLPRAADQHDQAVSRPAGEAAQMVLNAIRNDYPVIVTDPTHRKGFEQGYVRYVLDAFDEAARFDAENAV
ncbi:MAG: SDR family NAD(P)-dependent oxidoreductase [Novosphingobium sp.]|nr:SDR family NAD(P)-dependent oxidoreductase [Novosphingobium sp.]MCP5404156.1 SDR family NAD(P)-dependent oxidoreductase [Novosphingobium sp.]